MSYYKESDKNAERIQLKKQRYQLITPSFQGTAF
jgi:hypothetical protein